MKTIKGKISIIILLYMILINLLFLLPTPHKQPVTYPRYDVELHAAAPQEELESLGTFLITGYCSCYECSEEFGAMTSTGVYAQPHHTIAVDPRVIPYGTTVIIDGNEYVAEDCGGLIKEQRIDVYCESHLETFSNYCNGYKEVFIKK